MNFRPPRNSSIQIFVKATDGANVTVDAKPSDTIGHVKELVYDEQEIPPKRQRLVFGGGILEDDKTLAACGVQNQSTLLLVMLPEVSIAVETLIGKKFTLDVTVTTDTVKDIKAMIEKKEKIPIHKQRLIFAGKIMQDDKLLSEYSIQRESTLHLVIAKN